MLKVFWEHLSGYHFVAGSKVQIRSKTIKVPELRQTPDVFAKIFNGFQVLTFSKEFILRQLLGYLIHLYIFISPAIPINFGKFVKERPWHITILISKSRVINLKLCLTLLSSQMFSWNAQTKNRRSQTDAHDNVICALPRLYHLVLI